MRGISAKQKRAVLDYRRREGVTAAEHDMAVADLDLNAGLLDLGLLDPPPSSTSADAAASASTSTSVDATEAAASEAKPGGGENNESRCIFCMEKKPNVVCIPCGHVCMCEEDCKRFDAQSDRRCPICRVHVEQTMRIYH